MTFAAYGLLLACAALFVCCAGKAMSVTNSSEDTTSFPKAIVWLLLAVACAVCAVVGLHLLHGVGRRQLWLAPAALGLAALVAAGRKLMTPERVERCQQIAVRFLQATQRHPGRLFGCFAVCELTLAFAAHSVIAGVLGGIYLAMAVFVPWANRHAPKPSTEDQPPPSA